MSVPRESDRVGRRAVLFGLFLLFWLVLINLPTQRFLPELDTSWQGALSHFVFKGLQFGRDVIFTYGPLGYITADTYSGHLLASRIGFDLALKGVFALLMAALAVRLRPVLRWWFAVNIVFFSAVSPDAVYVFAIALSACLVIESSLSPGRALGVGVLFAFVSLTKFTCFLQSGASLLVVVAYALSKRKWRRASGLAIMYLVCLLSLWCVAGQPVSGFPPFLRGAYEVASGYAEAMAFHEPRAAFWGGLGALLLGGAIFVGLAHGGKDKGRDLAMLSTLLVGLFVAWKEGFVRADHRHIYTLFAFLLLAEPAAWAVFQPPGRHRRLLLGMTLLALVSPYVFLFLTRPGYFAELLPRVRDRVVETGAAFVHPRDFRAALDGTLSRVKEQNALPTIKRLVGQESVDVFGDEQAIALLNDLDYRPRPVFQGYSAYTPFLAACNRRFYLGPTAPAFVILKYQTVDDRFAAEDDAGALEVILRDYEPVATEKEYMLWKRKAVSQPLMPHRLVREGTAMWGEPLPLLSDQCPVWIEVEIGSTWLGKLREFLYKPAKITMTLESIDHETRRYRLVRPLGRSGFMVNPAVCNLSDLMEMYKNPGKGNTASVTFDVANSARWLYSPKYHYRIYVEGMN
ncbi:MAG: hypothetical protein ACLP0A_01690 [Verrucomicrobiia bacterium]